MKYIIVSLLMAVTLLQTSCIKQLDRFPVNDRIAENVFNSVEGYRQSLAKLYASMAVTGSPVRDIPRELVNDEGSTGFLRQYWYLQCLPTDEAGWTWSGDTDPIGIHQMAWSAASQTVAGLYYRCFYTISICNNVIRESQESKLTGKGFTADEHAMIRNYSAEARFLRAFNYWVLLDNFGSVPFVDEQYVIGSGKLTRQLSRADLFGYIEEELLDLSTSLVPARSNENGRADRAAAWALLARLYLNAQVYTGQERNADAVQYASEVINAGYGLHDDYTELMLADNHLLQGSEFIWSIRYDGSHTQSYSGTTFLVHSPAGVPAAISGTNGSWDGIRMTEQFVSLFDVSEDVRGQFWTQGQTLLMTSLLGNARAGYSSIKFRNRTRTGEPGPNTDATGTFVDVDFPVFRLAEMYLIYAEAVVRGGGGSSALALQYLQQLAQRARPADADYLSVPSLTLDYILDERGRELFWEGHRRTDLIRFNKFTTANYLWAWKGGVRDGVAVDAKYAIYPLPQTELSTNGLLVQNAGY